VTIRIEFIRRADRTIIRLIGQIEAEHLSELKAQIGAGGTPIVIEMQEVTLVDLDVVRFLIKCERQGITLRGCSAYIREWIDRERQDEI
jgi:anti-anti-sigma regulatory factor